MPRLASSFIALFYLFLLLPPSLAMLRSHSWPSLNSDAYDNGKSSGFGIASKNGGAHEHGHADQPPQRLSESWSFGKPKRDDGLEYLSHHSQLKHQSGVNIHEHGNNQAGSIDGSEGQNWSRAPSIDEGSVISQGSTHHSLMSDSTDGSKPRMFRMEMNKRHLARSVRPVPAYVRRAGMKPDFRRQCYRDPSRASGIRCI